MAMYRTKFQQDIVDALTKAGIPFYDRETSVRGQEISLLVDLPGGRTARYWPTFVITGDEGTLIVIQQKGRFVTADRMRLVELKKQHPTVEFRLIFSNSKQRISTKSPTTYALWAERYGFAYCDAKPSKEWIAELQSRTARQVQA